jgi:hypothetical protein
LRWQFGKILAKLRSECGKGQLAEGLAFHEAGFADAVGDAAFAALVRLFGDQHVQELRVGQALPLGAGQGVVVRVPNRIVVAFVAELRL